MESLLKVLIVLLSVEILISILHFLVSFRNISNNKRVEYREKMIDRFIGSWDRAIVQQELKIDEFILEENKTRDEFYKEARKTLLNDLREDLKNEK